MDHISGIFQKSIRSGHNRDNKCCLLGDDIWDFFFVFLTFSTFFLGLRVTGVKGRICLTTYILSRRHRQEHCHISASPLKRRSMCTFIVKSQGYKIMIRIFFVELLVSEICFKNYYFNYILWPKYIEVSNWKWLKQKLKKLKANLIYNCFWNLIFKNSRQFQFEVSKLHLYPLYTVFFSTLWGAIWIGVISKLKINTD